MLALVPVTMPKEREKKKKEYFAALNKYRVAIYILPDMRLYPSPTGQPSLGRKKRRSQRMETSHELLHSLDILDPPKLLQTRDRHVPLLSPRYK